ncbi:hypothetical protein BH23PLA1_BH23PLA1_15560 [soil metagenome]
MGHARASPQTNQDDRDIKVPWSCLRKNRCPRRFPAACGEWSGAALSILRGTGPTLLSWPLASRAPRSNRMLAPNPAPPLPPLAIPGRSPLSGPGRRRPGIGRTPPPSPETKRTHLPKWQPCTGRRPGQMPSIEGGRRGSVVDRPGLRREKTNPSDRVRRTETNPRRRVVGAQNEPDPFASDREKTNPSHRHLASKNEPEPARGSAFRKEAPGPDVRRFPSAVRWVRWRRTNPGPRLESLIPQRVPSNRPGAPRRTEPRPSPKTRPSRPDSARRPGPGPLAPQGTVSQRGTGTRSSISSNRSATSPTRSSTPTTARSCAASPLQRRPGVPALRRTAHPLPGCRFRDAGRWIRPGTAV